jgi:hypothetical protein
MFVSLQSAACGILKLAVFPAIRLFMTTIRHAPYFARGAFALLDVLSADAPLPARLGRATDCGLNG